MTGRGPWRIAASTIDAVPPSLHAARDRFLDMIEPHLMAFKALRATLACASDGRAELVEVGSRCHKIAGVAETLGFAHAGNLAGQLDAAIDEGLAANALPRVVWQRVDPALEALMDELDGMLDRGTRR